MTGNRLRLIFDYLYGHYGPQAAWWPIFTEQPQLEIVLGALLVQQTRWERVELAILALRDALGPSFSAQGVASADPQLLAELIRPVAYYNAKAPNLRRLAAFFAEHPAGALGAALASEQEELRRDLLALPGVGPETADTILLYAGQRPAFIVDAYTRRVFARLGDLPADPERASYHELQRVFTDALRVEDYADYPYLEGSLSRLYAEYHALIVEHGVRHCTARRPRCDTPGATRVYTSEAGRVWRCPPCQGCPASGTCGFYHSIIM